MGNSANTQKSPPTPENRREKEGRGERGESARKRGGLPISKENEIG